MNDGVPLMVPKQSYARAELALQRALRPIQGDNVDDGANAVVIGSSGRQGGIDTPTRQQVLTIPVKNVAGGDFGAYSIVAPTGGLYDPSVAAELARFKKRRTLEVSTPVAYADAGAWMILLESIADEKMGLAAIAGAVACQIDVVDANHQYATCITGDSAKLKSGGFGARILWKESGTGIKWASVLLPSQQPKPVFEPVTLTIDGGANGDDENPPTWTYTAVDLDGVTVGTTLTPERKRASVGFYLSGNGETGTGYWDKDGAFHLFDANERAEQEACS